MSRLLLASVSAAAGFALLTGCDFGTSATPVKTVTSTANPSTNPSGDASTEPSAAAQPSDTPSPATAKTYPDAKAAAVALVAAWHIGDKNAALLAAGPNTVEKVFASAVNTDASIEGCNPGKDGGVTYAYDCYYTYDGGSSHFYVDPYPATGWRVVNYTQVAD